MGSQAIVITTLEEQKGILERMPTHRDLSLAITKIDEAILWLKESIEREKRVTYSAGAGR